ncbi:O-antigen ligase domain-containing protein [Paenibacillaceae bacterium]|nr:O-antigen ligase domain-containing protein [Paenibacillaceae bacterium]
MAALIGVTLMYCAYRNGMFFDSSYYRFAIVLCLLGAVVEAVLLVRLLRSDVHTGLNWPVERTSWAMLLVAVLYLLHLWWTEPVSVMGTLEHMIRFAGYGAYALLLSLLLKVKEGVVAVQIGLYATAAYLIVSGIAGWFGWLSFPQFVMVSSDPQLTAVGARLGGFFQYPNMYGAAIAALLLWLILLLTEARRIAVFLPAALLAAPCLLVLLLTESRGAWVSAAAGWLLALALLRGRDRVAWLLFSGVTGSVAPLLYRLTVHAGSEVSGQTPVSASSLLLIFLVVCGGLIALVVSYLAYKAYPIFQKFYGIVIGLLMSGFAALLLMPLVVQGRVGDGQYETATARQLFYTDAWRLAGEAPWWGRGGDAWRMQFHRIQQQPYVGSEVHNGYLDMLLNLGLAGTVVLCVLLLMWVLRVWKGGRVGLVPMAVLLMHAFIDFDMSYAFYWLLLITFVGAYGGLGGYRLQAGTSGERERLFERKWLSVRGLSAIGNSDRDEWRPHRSERQLSRNGQMHEKRAAGEEHSQTMAGDEQRSEGESQNQAKLSDEPRTSDPPRVPARRVSHKAPRGAMRPRRLTRAATAALALLLFAAAGLASLRLERAYMARAVAGAADTAAARTAALRATLQTNPYWTRIRLELAPHVPLSERAALLAAGLRYEPQSAPLNWELGKLFAEFGNVRPALTHMRQALQLDRFDKAKQSEAVELLAQLALDLRKQGREPEARLAAEGALSLYSAYAALVAEMDALPHLANGRRFEMVETAEAAAETCRMVLGK